MVVNLRVCENMDIHGNKVNKQNAMVGHVWTLEE